MAVSSTGHCNTARRSSPVWRLSNSSIESQDLRHSFSFLERPGDVGHPLAALPALPELSPLLRREPCPCMPLHMHIVPTGQIRREGCCVDQLNPPPKADILIAWANVRFRG